ncbi:MAG: PQQ-binding-like beta-propeller repeat protein, partial [Oligoflexia bacterium]|nr:PQQ-binding-like beta-propeller repeat protein [Oligoflexia bacterium]
GRLIARQYQDGIKKYVVDLGDAVESPASVDDKGRMYLHLRNHKIVALDALSGKVLWSYIRSVSFKTTIQQVSTPVIYQGKLYVGFADASVFALTPEEGVLIWERAVGIGSKFVDVDMTPTFHDGLLYIASCGGPLMVLNPETGVILRRYEYQVYRPPLFVDNVGGMLIGTDHGEVLYLDKYGAVKNSVKLPISTASVSRSRASARTRTHASIIFSFVPWEQKIVERNKNGNGNGSGSGSGNASGSFKGFFVLTKDGEFYFLDWPTLQPRPPFNLGTKNSVVFGYPAKSEKENRLAIFSARNRLYVFDPVL